jgi:hypothetical protein
MRSFGLERDESFDFFSNSAVELMVCTNGTVLQVDY